MPTLRPSDVARIKRHGARRFVHEFELRCRHGVSSGSPCRLCGDVVPNLTGHKPWWSKLWQLWQRLNT